MRQLSSLHLVWESTSSPPPTLHAPSSPPKKKVQGPFFWLTTFCGDPSNEHVSPSRVPFDELNRQARLVPAERKSHANAGAVSATTFLKRGCHPQGNFIAFKLPFWSRSPERVFDPKCPATVLETSRNSRYFHLQGREVYIDTQGCIVPCLTLHSTNNTT